MKINHTLLVLSLILFSLYNDLYSQWVQTNGPCSPTVLSMAANGNDIYVGTSGGGLFRSSNNGSSFSYVNSDLYSTTITAVAIESFGVLAGTGGSGVFVSTNQGANWITRNNGLSNLTVNSIVSIGQNLFAGTGGGGVFLSVDNGTSWTSMNSGLTNLNVNKLYVSGTKLFAGTSSGGFVSENNGVSWSNITSTLSNKNIKSILLNGTRIIVGNNSGVFYSDNNGSSWTNPATNTGSATNSLEIVGSVLFAATSNGGCFRSTDNGVNWTTSNNNFGFFNKTGNILLKVGTTIYYGSNGGGLFKSTDNGSTWVDNNIGLTSSTVRALYESGGKLYSGVLGGGIYTSTNNGSTWVNQNNGIPDINLSFLAFTSSGTTVFAGAYSSVFPSITSGIYYSTNSGSQWIQCFSGKSIYALTTSTNAGSTKIFAGASDGLYYSTNNGTQWTNISSIPSGIVQSIAFDGALGLASKYYNGRPYLTTDYGNTWNQVAGTVPNTNVQTIAINGTTLVVGTNNGVYKSTDYGNIWIPMNDGLPQYISVNCLIKVSSSGSGNIKGSNNSLLSKSQSSDILGEPVEFIICTQSDGSYVFMSGKWSQMNDGLGNGTTNYTMFLSGDNAYVGTYAYGVSVRTVTNISNTYGTRYRITLNANPNDGGTVTGAGTYGSDFLATVTATAYPGYLFIDWTENGNTVSTQDKFTFTLKTDRNLTANFARQNYTITASCNPPEGGTVLGAQTYPGGTEATLIAEAKEGYRFVKWTENNAVVSTQYIYRFPVSSNRNLVAVFELLKLLVKTESYPAAGGATTGDGEYLYKQNVTVTASPNIGYKFDKWYVQALNTQNEPSPISISPTFNFDISHSVLMIASFEKAKVKIIANSEPEAGGSGKVFETETDTAFSYSERMVPLNITTMIIAVNNEGYEFTDWTEHGIVISTEEAFVFVADKERTFTAHFKLLKPSDISDRVPVNEATNVSTNITLFWRNAQNRNVSKTKIFLSPTIIDLNGNPIFETTKLIDSYKHEPRLEFNTKYMWTVVQENEAGIFLNDIFSFITASASAVDDEIIPTEFKLYQNFPNPFNPTTRIRFEIPKESNVKISVHNILGVEVLKIVDRLFTVGTHIMNLSLENLTSGIYFCTMISDSYKETIKLLYLK